MKTNRLALLILGVLVAAPAVALVVVGATLTAALLFARDGDGYVSSQTEAVASGAPVVIADDIDLTVDPGTPDIVFDALDLDVRVEVTPTVDTDELFLGIGPSEDVEAYFAGVEIDEVVDIDDRLDVVFDNHPGSDTAPDPTAATFWAVSSTGEGTQQIEWRPESGEWTAVVMNADGSPGVVFDVGAGVRSDAFGAILAGTIVAGLALGAIAVAMLIASGRGDRRSPTAPPAPTAPPHDSGVVTPHTPDHDQLAPVEASPVQLNATLDPNLSPWLWLVKWLAAIPHFIIVMILWFVFVLTTAAAGVAILFTGRYPRSLFDLNVGILRWSWRTSYYAANGGIGSDVYPHFDFEARPGDHATLDIVYPERLSRPLVLVKWLLAVPHLLIVGLLAGGTYGWSQDVEFTFGGGILGLLTLAAGIILLFTKTYPQALFDLIVGFNRWVYRTIAYVALMTDDYPPFRLDQGGHEPTAPRIDPPDRPRVDLTDGPPPAGDRPLPESEIRRDPHDVPATH